MKKMLLEILEIVLVTMSVVVILSFFVKAYPATEPKSKTISDYQRKIVEEGDTAIVDGTEYYIFAEEKHGFTER